MNAEDMELDEAAEPAADPDLSTFECRWAEALGAPDSYQVADFRTAGASYAGVWQTLSHQCRSLQKSEPTDFSDPEGLSFLAVESCEGKFLSLSVEGKYMFVRPFYEFLYQATAAKWSSRGQNRVLVNGNAGTGKSWFQLYALRRLLQGYGQDHRYLFVVRQVRSDYFLIDLSNAEVRKLKIGDVGAVNVLDLFKRQRVLYFFEPLSDRSVLPEPTTISSLTTLSPFEERIHEYVKDHLAEFTFPGWTLEDLALATMNDPQIRLTVEIVENRFHRFGGIIRHVLAESTLRYEKDQRALINSADLAVLRATTTGINSDPNAPGKNVSGFLLCYCNIATLGPDRFKENGLDFTSDYVRSEIRARMKDYSIKEHIGVVVDRLNGAQMDRGGLHLQETASFLLSQGSSVSWQCKTVTVAGGSGGQWSAFRTRARDVVKSYEIFEHLGAPNKVLVSTNPNFPLADIVFSHPAPISVLDMFQVTWHATHPFTVRALYQLRELSLRIQDTVRIQVLFVTPEQEDTYATYPKHSFLKGNVGVDLNYSSTTRVASARLQLMWQNTEIVVLKPKLPWIDLLRRYR